MLYVVEMDLPDRSLEAEWHQWYVSHIRKLLTVSGYNGAQRFCALAPSESPFLAIHDVTDADVFESAQYRAVGGPQGTGQWRDLMTNWHRNLYVGCESLPAVELNETLVLIDDRAILDDRLAPQVTWLESVGLDRSITRRGLAVFAEGDELAGLADADNVHRYKPISEKLR